jgi:hypothetical protein
VITPKATRCASLCWRIVTAHPGITARGIVGAQSDYDAREVAAALGRLEADGLVERDCQRACARAVRGGRARVEGVVMGGLENLQLRIKKIQV